MPKFILKINQNTDKIYRDDDIACYLLDASLPTAYLKDFKSDGRPRLLCGTNASKLCRELGFEGVVADISSDKPIKAQIAKIRAELGEHKFLGTVIAPHRHEAMLVSETEPEFVAFRFSAAEKAAAIPVISWYNELFLIQSAVDLRGGLQDLKDTDCDFVIINSHDYKDFGC